MKSWLWVVLVILPLGFLIIYTLHSKSETPGNEIQPSQANPNNADQIQALDVVCRKSMFEKKKGMMHIRYDIADGNTDAKFIKESKQNIANEIDQSLGENNNEFRSKIFEKVYNKSKNINQSKTLDNNYIENNCQISPSNHNINQKPSLGGIDKIQDKFIKEIYDENAVEESNNQVTSKDIKVLNQTPLIKNKIPFTDIGGCSVIMEEKNQGKSDIDVNSVDFNKQLEKRDSLDSYADDFHENNNININIESNKNVVGTNKRSIPDKLVNPLEIQLSGKTRFYNSSNKVSIGNSSHFNSRKSFRKLDRLEPFNDNSKFYSFSKFRIDENESNIKSSFEPTQDQPNDKRSVSLRAIAVKRNFRRNNSCVNPNGQNLKNRLGVIIEKDIENNDRSFDGSAKDLIHLKTNQKSLKLENMDFCPSIDSIATIPCSELKKSRNIAISQKDQEMVTEKNPNEIHSPDTPVSLKLFFLIIKHQCN